ncbi:MAG TPA: hypothetical protein VLO07_06125 [Thermoanaerobaculia bacterium]|nr:hypothetical protein [Thermoanaerobaculia bacterium]
MNSLVWAANLLWLLAPGDAGAAQGSVAGVRWSVPARWREQPPRQMRVATYLVPGTGGAEAGECAVFYFGKGQGGSVEENVARWTKQFEAPANAKTTTRSVGGMRVHVVDLSGTYLGTGGPMMESQERKPNYRLLGAIVEAPGGLLFFKCTGPASTISQAQEEFDRLIQSLMKGETTTI